MTFPEGARMVKVVGKLLTVFQRNGETIVRALERSEYPSAIKDVVRSSRFGLCNVWCVLDSGPLAEPLFGCQSDDCADDCVLTKHVIGDETYWACQCVAKKPPENVIPLHRPADRHATGRAEPRH
jgi:hypothetical protein